jgi:cell division protein FtsI (penicillin-binding protein 3)
MISAERRVLTVPEIFIHSSNIGTAKMALDVGTEKHQEFLRRVGLFDRLQTELPESAKPLLPRHWSKLATATAAFGHGFAVQPLQGVAVVCGLLNGGNMMTPTLLKRDRADAEAMANRIVSAETSEKMRYLFRLNVEEGTAANANVPGYRVGGKTGTAEKVVNGRYAKDKRLTSFIGAFPMDAPRYALLVMLDEPNATPETFGFATSGWNAVPTAGKIIERIAPILGVVPILSDKDRAVLEKQAKAEKAKR